LACFAEIGFGGTRLQDIAERAGVTTALLYRYFPDKGAIFEATVRRFLVPSLADVEAQVRARRGHPAAALREVLAVWWGAMTDPQVAALPRVVLGETHRFPAVAKLYAREVVGRRHRLLRDVLRWGIAVGVFRELSVDVAARVLAAPVHFGAIYTEALQPYDDWGMPSDDYLAGAVEMAVASVLRPTG
jgi:AcrR family transcriptional regulator